MHLASNGCDDGLFLATEMANHAKNVVKEETNQKKGIARKIFNIVCPISINKCNFVAG
jgi:hypothetical protein